MDNFPLNQASSPVETFMKPLWKTVKVTAQHEKKLIKDVILELQDNYRNNQQPATDV